MRQDGVTLCYSILLELTQDNAGYLFSQAVNKDTLLGEWGSRYASLVSEPMDLSRVQDHLLRLKTYDTEGVVGTGTGGEFFEVPKGCFEFARHVRLVFNNWYGMQSMSYFFFDIFSIKFYILILLTYILKIFVIFF